MLASEAQPLVSSPGDDALETELTCGGLKNLGESRIVLNDEDRSARVRDRVSIVLDEGCRDFG